MKIYQVEELVGITKKNIRFYEDEGLLNPDRNPENGYREYSLKDVRQLQKIKLLRKLDIPIEEIRLLQEGKTSFSEIMNRQIQALEKKQKDAQIMVELCSKMKDDISDLNQLDAESYLSEMYKMETNGTKFVDIEKRDINRKKKAGSIIAAVVFCLIQVAIDIPLTIQMKKSPSIKVGLIIVMVLSFLVIGGIITVLVQRLKEINKGEEYEARNY